MNDRRRIKKSHKLAILLRHDAKYSFKQEGWRAVSNVLEILQISFEDLVEIVNKDSKKRYAFSNDKTKIRAVDGYDEFIPHSPKTPADNYPDTLYHGTSLTSVVSILEQGIQRMGRGKWKRAYVNLSSDKATALKVGARKGSPVVLCINTSIMTEQGYKLYEPESEPWTADEVPVAAIEDKMYIGQTVAYYETEEQCAAIYDICTSNATKEIILEEYKEEVNLPICSFQCFDGNESVLESIVYENNSKDKTIVAYIPLGINTNAQGYERLQEQLSDFIKELQRTFIAAPVMDLMPEIEIKDRLRALFYLEMSALYESSKREFKMPIDWFDIRRLCEINRRFRFHSPFVASTISSLFSLISKHIESFNAKASTSCIIWLDLPAEARESHSEIMDFIREMRKGGMVLLLGVSSIPDQKAFKASVSILEE